MGAVISMSSSSEQKALLKSSSSPGLPYVAVVRNRRSANGKSKVEAHHSCDTRTRLLIIVICASFLVYFAFYADALQWKQPMPQMVVRVPQNDIPDGTCKICVLLCCCNCRLINIYLFVTVPSEYLVYSPNCQIPALDPLASDVMALFRHLEYTPCSNLPALTYVTVDESTNIAQLHINASLLRKYNIQKRGAIDRCCYQEIRRSGIDHDADRKFTLGTCIPIKKNIATLEPSHEFILVRCKSGDSAIYTNTHAIMRPRPDIRERLDTFAANHVQRPLSVLMMSIDSISRLNLLRALPKTAQHMYDNGWFELQGYNKVFAKSIF